MARNLFNLAKYSNHLLKSNKQFSQKLFESTAAYTARYEFETLLVTSPAEHVLKVELNRPEDHNSINKEMFRELLECFKRINDDTYARAIVLCGSGKRFSSGMDYNDMYRYLEKISGKQIKEDSTTVPLKEDVARKAKLIRSMLIQFQDSFTVLEKCSKPIIAAITGSCTGEALGLALCTDVRYASEDAYFSVKEVNNGHTPSLGTLQRLPKVTGNSSIARELVFTAKKLSANEAKEIGLLSKVFADQETCKQAALETAQLIAKKSPVAVQGSKVLLKYSREHSTWDGLRMNLNWNMSMLQSSDLYIAATSLLNNKEPEFEDL